MHDYVCPDCGFASLGHPSEEARDARAAAHVAEHESGEPAPELNTQDGDA